MKGHFLTLGLTISFLILLTNCKVSNELETSTKLQETKEAFILSLEKSLGLQSRSTKGSQKAQRITASNGEVWKEITTKELKALIDSKSTDFTLIDARNHIEYRDSHIVGSLSIPAAKITTILPEKVTEKDWRLIFYCNGPKCSKSRKAAKFAASIGYTNLWVYNGGIPAWRKTRYPIKGEAFPKVNIPLISAKQLSAEKGKIFLIDVRDQDEHQLNNIPNTDLNAPLDSIEKKLDEIPKDKKVVLYDRVGKQTLLGGRLLWRHGFKNVFRLDGGWVKGWLKRNK
ncbi:MAG: hypothetical protein IEMM0008_1204 [bacterium]|nr:MAG: hypothetical protein IEMM0008_1204 [bacterium]